MKRNGGGWELLTDGGVVRARNVALANNGFIRRFPYNLTAKMFGLGKPREYFEAEPGAEEAPKVQF